MFCIFYCGNLLSSLQTQSFQTKCCLHFLAMFIMSMYAMSDFNLLNFHIYNKSSSCQKFFPLLFLVRRILFKKVCICFYICICIFGGLISKRFVFVFVYSADSFQKGFYLYLFIRRVLFHKGLYRFWIKQFRATSLSAHLTQIVQNCIQEKGKLERKVMFLFRERGNWEEKLCFFQKRGNWKER